MKILISIFLLTILFGCSLRSPHQRFIDDMNTLVDYNLTIKKWEDPKFDASGTASKKYLAEIEALSNGDYKYHYAHPNIFGRFCHYYLLVDGETKKVKGWGFDHEKSDPKVECARSG